MSTKDHRLHHPSSTTVDGGIDRVRSGGHRDVRWPWTPGDC